MALAPIVLFVYNRPEHTRRTLEALASNPEARESDLYIFSDGTKRDDKNSNYVNVQQVRRLVASEQWCKNVIIEHSETNKGLAQSIIDGVTKVVEKHGKVIVLEDDIVTSCGFLRYMNDALDLYEKEEKVMHIAAHIPPLDIPLPDTFFYNSTSCWGWGTWASAWKNLRRDAKVLLTELEEKNRLSAFTLEQNNDNLAQLNDNISGKCKTWAVKWNASVFLLGGFSLHPGKPLVKNIGFDGSGTNCQEIAEYDSGELADSIPVEPILIEESTHAREGLKKFYYDTLSLSLMARVRRKLRRVRS